MADDPNSQNLVPAIAAIAPGDLTSFVPTGIMPPVCGAVAQLGERYNRTVEVRGSNPLSSTWLHQQPLEE